MRPTAASLALGISGLFGYHALYFAALKLAPPAEANLISSLWALLDRAVLGPAAGAPPAPARTSSAALLGLAAAAMLVWDKLGVGSDADASAARALCWRFGCALVWSSYSVASRLLADVPSESIAVSCLATAALALRLQPRVRGVDDARRRASPGWRWSALGWARSAPPSCCGTSA